MPDYPIPSGAAYIWTAGDQIWLGLPPSEGHEHGSSIHVPASDGGLRRILMILRERERVNARKATIGSKAVPVQYDIEKMEAAMLRHTKSKAEKAKERSEAEDLLRLVGLVP